MRAGEVSEVSQDYLKAIWSAQEWGGKPMTATELANRFGTTKANVTEVLKRLDELGLIVRVPYRPPVLTPAGEKVALSMVRRHRLLETFLVESLGYGWDEVHDEAEILEHAASDRLVDRIDAFLGRPQSDPHGDPIPDPEGQIESHDSSILLTEAGPGVLRGHPGLGRRSRSARPPRRGGGGPRCPDRRLRWGRQWAGTGCGRGRTERHVLDRSGADRSGPYRGEAG